MSFNVQPSASKNFYNCALVSNGQNFLRCSSLVTVFKFGSNKIFHFFLRSDDSFSINTMEDFTEHESHHSGIPFLWGSRSSGDSGSLGEPPKDGRATE